MSDVESSWVLLCAGKAKRAERSGLPWTFGPTFSFKRKGGKTNIKRTDKRVKTPTAMLRQAQHDKAQEAL